MIEWLLAVYKLNVDNIMTIYDILALHYDGRM